MNPLLTYYTVHELLQSPKTLKYNTKKSSDKVKKNYKENNSLYLHLKN